MQSCDLAGTNLLAAVQTRTARFAAEYLHSVINTAKVGINPVITWTAWRKRGKEGGGGGREKDHNTSMHAYKYSTPSLRVGLQRKRS